MNNNDEMIFEAQNIVFRISNEVASGIDTENPKTYDPKLKNLLDAAREVKGQKFFGDVEVALLAKDYPFIPFKYQVENVNAMLNRFEGRGVFGDQVGLGKTVEALMTAHAMFESGAIRNVLLVVPERTKDDWIKEIEEKFPKLFTVHDRTKYAAGNEVEHLMATFGEMANNKKDRNRGENDIYIITDAMLTKDLKQVREQLSDFNNCKYKDNIKPRDRAFLNELKEKLDRIDLTTPVVTIQNILCYFGYNDPGRIRTLFSDSSMSEQKLEETIKLLKATRDRVRNIPSKNMDKEHQRTLVDELNHYIKEFEGQKRTWDELYARITRYDLNNIWSVGPQTVADPTIDLMIIDEIHSFYESDYANITIETFRKRQKSTMDIIANFEKKFCVLLSATPIRTALEDVFDLVYMVDRKRFGMNKDEAYKYFYNTICRVSPAKLNPLNDIFADEDNKARKNTFFGVINSFFTRKRINSVSDDMTGLAEGKLPLYSDIAAAIGSGFLKALDASIEKKLTMMYKQDMYDNETATKKAKETYNRWSKGEFVDEYDELYLRAAIDAVIMSVLKSEKITDKEQLNKAYSVVNWNRRGKRGIAFDANINDPELCNLMDSDSKKRAAKAILLVKYLSSVRRSLQMNNFGINDMKNLMSENGFVIASFENLLEGCAEASEMRNFLIYQAIDPFISGLCRDAILCYLSDSVFQDKMSRSMIGKCMATHYKYENDQASRAHNVVYDNQAQEERVADKNYNQIAIVNEQQRAGINYQDYSTFIFAHMDIKGERLLEPVDIEQWIGRVHRTGQVKECRIITILTTIMKDPSKNPDSEFLKWYYEILADPQGLDLYGNNTPDIAFLQPIIVDILRAKIVELKKQSDCNMFFKKMKLTNTILFQKYSFSELMEFFYHRKDQEYVKNMIRELCKIPEFGKAPAEK